MTKRFALFAFASACLAACETPVSAPALLTPDVTGPLLAKIINERADNEPFGFPNPCQPQEFIAGTFDAHTVITESDGKFRLHFNTANIHGVGTPSGDRYTGAQNVKIVESVSGPDFELEIKDHFRVIRQGSGDNFYAWFWIRVTNDDVEVVRIEGECRG